MRIVYSDDPFDEPFDGTPPTSFQIELLDCCGRKKYHDETEARKGARIERMYKQFPEYIKFWINWTRVKNADRLAIRFSVLLKMILDKDRRKEFYLKNGIKDKDYGEF